MSTDKYLRYQLSNHFSVPVYILGIYPIRQILVFTDKTKHLNPFTHSQCLIDQYSLHTKYIPTLSNLARHLIGFFYDFANSFSNSPFLISKQTVNRFFGTFFHVYWYMQLILYFESCGHAYLIKLVN